MRPSMQETVYPRSSPRTSDARQFGRQRPRGNRPVASVNLGKLADVVGNDVLASSLGLTEQVLVKIIQGQEVAQDYQAHIEHHFKEAGIPSSWLNQTNASIKPEVVTALRRIAAGSVNKAPTRRHNFQVLVDAFQGRIEAMSDALDISEPSIRGLADGRLEITEERVNHLNPRLMRAGFPDGWLDQPRAQVEESWVPKLEAIAAAEEQEAEAQRQVDAAQRKANPPATPVTAAVIAPTPSATPALASATASVPSAVDQGQQQPLFDVPADTTAPQAAAPAQISPPSPPALARKPVIHLIPKEMPPMATAQKTPAKPAFKSGNFAGAGKPSSTPMLPRGAMGAGRTVGKPVAPAPAAKTPAAKTAPIASAGAKKVGAVSRVKTPPAAPVSRVKAAAPAPAPMAAPAPAPAPAPVAAKTAPASASKLNTRGGKTPVSKATSKKRAVALEKLLKTARRGAKVTLWRDLLNSSLPYWGNIRRGTVLMRDEMADDITVHLGLPQGWLDKPVFPPPTLAEWLTDPNTPLPAPTKDSTASAATPDAAPAAPAAARKPFARTPAPPATATLHSKVTPPAAPPRRPASVPAATAPSAAPVTRAQAPVSTSPQPSVQLSAAAHAPAAVQAGEAGTFTWAPASAPQPIPATGPAVQVLSSVINQMSLDGRFTEQDALRLIMMLAGTR